MLHWSLIFLVIALIAAILGFGGLAGTAVGIAKILFFVFLVCGFLFVTMLFAEDVLRALAWPAILAGNVLAVVAMALYLKPRHPNVRMLP